VLAQDQLKMVGGTFNSRGQFEHLTDLGALLISVAACLPAVTAAEAAAEPAVTASLDIFFKEEKFIFLVAQ